MTAAEAILFDRATGHHDQANVSCDYTSPIGAPSTASLFEGQDESARSRRLAVYTRLHLQKASSQLRQHFGATATALGEARYGRAVKLYVSEVPSTRPQLRWQGHKFAEFLRSQSTQQQLAIGAEPWLADLARLDWAQSLATDAPVEDALQFSDLRALPREQWAQLHITWLGCVQRVDSPYNLLSVRTAALSEPPSGVVAVKRAPQLTLAGVGTVSSFTQQQPLRRHWLVTRRGVDVLSLELSTSEARLFDALRHPLSLTELSDLVAAELNLDAAAAARHAVACVQQWSGWNCLKSALRTSLPPCP